MKPCTKCGRLISPLETFTKGECVDCHERDYRDDGTPPDFTGTITL